METVPRTIIAAAIKIGPVTFVGVRHWDTIMRSQVSDHNLKELRSLHGFDQDGFIDNKGAFLDRVEALELVKANGQPFYPERNGADDELYSEGVW